MVSRISRDGCGRPTREDIPIPVRPRVAPAPISSGVSFRSLPDPSFAQIIKVCQHYEEKCAGMYDSKSPAARYLYDLSREVQDMVRVLKSGEDAATSRVRDLEYTLRDWNEVFASPSRALQAAGVTRSSNAPSVIARLILELSDKVQQTEIESLSSRVHLEKEIGDLRSALRDASRVAREQAVNELVRLKDEADQVIREERAARAMAAADLDKCRRTMADDIRASVASEVAAQTAALRSELARVRSEADRDVSQSRISTGTAHAQLDAARDTIARMHDQAVQSSQEHDDEIRMLHGQIDALRVEMDAAARQAVDDLARSEASWRGRLVACHDRWAASTSAARTSQLEDQIAFLTTRIQQLQQLCESMQVALAGSDFETALQQAAAGGTSGSAAYASTSASASTSRTRITPAPPVPKSASGTKGVTSGHPSAPSAARPLRGVAVVRHGAVDAMARRVDLPAASSAAVETRYMSVR